MAAVYAHTHTLRRECARVVVWMRGEEEDGGAAHLANTTDTPRVCGVEWSVVECTPRFTATR